ncbi:hypothetical protein BDZ89DRAFT_514251 [Hymenopellis radicata]|nr:hypothetical protein BDZ89DRAFT_514251 [Hymenopellis radicata]
MLGLSRLRLSASGLPAFAIPLAGGLQRTCKTSAIKDRKFKPKRSGKKERKHIQQGANDATLRALCEYLVEDRAQERKRWEAYRETMAEDRARERKTMKKDRERERKTWEAYQDRWLQEWKRALRLECDVIEANVTVKRLQGNLTLKTGLGARRHTVHCCIHTTPRNHCTYHGGAGEHVWRWCAARHRRHRCRTAR